MSIKVKRLQDLLTIVYEVESMAAFNEVISSVLSETAAFQQELGKPVYRVIDLTKLGDELTFSAMMLAMAEERGKAGGADDPNVTTLFVGSGDLVRFGTEALQQQEQYGDVRVHLFETQKAALAFAWEQVR